MMDRLIQWSLQVERKIVVSCNVAGRDVTGVVRDIQKRVDPLVSAATGHRVEYAGQFECAAEANKVLALLGVVWCWALAFCCTWHSRPHATRCW